MDGKSNLTIEFVRDVITPIIMNQFCRKFGNCTIDDILYDSTWRKAGMTERKTNNIRIVLYIPARGRSFTYFCTSHVWIDLRDEEFVFPNGVQTRPVCHVWVRKNDTDYEHLLTVGPQVWNGQMLSIGDIAENKYVSGLVENEIFGRDNLLDIARIACEKINHAIERDLEVHARETAAKIETVVSDQSNNDQDKDDLDIVADNILDWVFNYPIWSWGSGYQRDHSRITITAAAPVRSEKDKIEIYKNGFGNIFINFEGCTVLELRFANENWDSGVFIFKQAKSLNRFSLKDIALLADKLRIKMNLLKLFLESETGKEEEIRIIVGQIQFVHNYGPNAERISGGSAMKFNASSVINLSGLVSEDSRCTEIKEAYWNPKTGTATIIWADGTKTMAKAMKGTDADPEIGFAICVAKKFFGTQNQYRKWLKSIVDASTASAKKKADKKLTKLTKQARARLAAEGITDPSQDQITGMIDKIEAENMSAAKAAQKKRTKKS